MSDSKEFQDAESIRSGNSHVSSRPAFFYHLFKILAACYDGPPSILDTQELHGVLIYQNQFTHHRRRRVRIKHQFRIRDASPDRQPEVQSSPAREILQIITGQKNNDCRFRILILTTSPRQQRFACWKIRFKIEVCTCSQFPSEAMLWMKEVEMVESVDDLKSSCSISGIPGPNFEVLDAKIASALNRIIQNTRFKKKVSLEEEKAPKGDRPFPSWKTDRSPDLRVLAGYWSKRFCR